MLPVAFGLGMAGNLLDSYGQHKQEEQQKKQIRAALNQKITDSRAEKNQLGISSKEAMNRAGQMLAKYKDNPQMTERSQQIYDSGLRYNKSLYSQANRVQQEANAELKNYGKSKFNWGSALAQGAVSGLMSNSMYGDKANNMFSGLLGKLNKPNKPNNGQRTPTDYASDDLISRYNLDDLTLKPKRYYSFDDLTWKPKEDYSIGGR